MLNYQSSSTPVTSTYNWRYYKQSTGVTTNAPASMTWVANVEYSAGDRTPRFRSRIRKGELIPFTSYINYSWTMSPGSMSYSVSMKNGDRYWDEGDLRLHPANALKVYDRTYLTSMVLSKAKINNKYLLQSAAANCYSQGYDALTAAVEFPETVRMFRDLSGRLISALNRDAEKAAKLKEKKEATKERFRNKHAKNASYFQSAMEKVGRRYTRNLRLLGNDRASQIREKESYDISRSFDLRRAQLNSAERRFNISWGKVFDSVSSDYLMVRYGIRPLIYDLRNLQELMVNWNKKQPFVVISHSNQNESVAFSEVSTSSGIGGIQTKTVEHDYRISYRATVAARFTPSKIQLNPIVTAWEATRLSFVVDWFVNVGNYLEQASLQVLSPQIVACLSSEIAGTTKVTMQGGQAAPGVQSFSNFGNGSLQFSLKTRNPASLPSFPQAKTRLDTYKLADLTALIGQAFRSSKRRS